LKKTETEKNPELVTSTLLFLCGWDGRQNNRKITDWLTSAYFFVKIKTEGTSLSNWLKLVCVGTLVINLLTSV
jgi:hypothetical protein